MNGLGKAALGLFFFLAALPGARAGARVIVFDAVTSVHTPAFVRVQTRGAVFSEGGMRVEVNVGENTVGTLLTGADGYGFIKYAPTRRGLLKITARSGDASGYGRLLSVLPTDPVIVVEIDGPVRQLPRLGAAVENAAATLRSLSGSFRIVYLAGMLGPAVDRAWLASVDVPESVVVSGKEEASLKALRKKGLFLCAVVGSEKLLKASEGIVPHRYGFETKDAKWRVDSWEALAERLRTMPQPKTGQSPH
jgi:hypothetical protein